MSQHTWIAVSVILLLALASVVPLYAGPSSNDDKNPEENSWLDEKWSTSRAYWRKAAAKARWQSIPWLRMTREKKHALWDEALRYALMEDDWLGRPPGEILFNRPEPEYTPNVPGLSFKDPDYAEIEELGQLTDVRIWHVSLWQELSSVNVWVMRYVRLSKERNADRERGRRKRIVLKCERSWGDWTCRGDEQWGLECNELAFDDRRWHTLEGFAMTREDKHAMWNGMLEHAEDFVDSLQGTIIIKSDRLDPTFVPAVEGMSFRLLSRAEIDELADSHGPVDYVSLGDQYDWYRGPVTVNMSMMVDTWTEPRTEPNSGTPRDSHSARYSRRIHFSCQRSSVGWSCEPR